MRSTQLSHYLLEDATVEGALQTALLLAMVWIVWASTTYFVNWLEPDHLAVRLLLMSIMLVSLLLSAGLPEAFGRGGLAVGGAYAVMQIGRNLFAVVAMRGEAIERTFQRVLIWVIVSGALTVVGGLQQGHVRELVWVLAVGPDLFGVAVGFYVPGLGRSALANGPSPAVTSAAPPSPLERSLPHPTRASLPDRPITGSTH